MKRTIVRRLAILLPVAGLVSLVLSGFLYMGAFSFVDSADASGCGGRLPYRSCTRSRDRDLDETKTIIRTTSTSTTFSTSTFVTEATD